MRSGHVTAHQQEVALHAIESSAAAQEQLIEDLLDISRLVSGRMRLEIRETDLISLIEDALETVRPAAELKGVQLETRLSSKAQMVRIDPDRVRQVVWNLVNNAVKFTPSGGQVTISTHRGPETVVIEVKDTGQGIAGDFLPHIFEQFRQADAGATRAHGGLGLGLAISRQLVELHGGTIGVESAGEGEGSIFTVRLPGGAPATALVGNRVMQAGRIEPTEGFVATSVLQNVRILLVEDDASARDAVGWLLEQCGAKVVGVNSAKAALDEFERTLWAPAQGQPLRFHLVISDIAMPDQDGFEMMRAMRKLEAGQGAVLTPAIAMTAYVRERDRGQALDAGFQEYLPKPIDPGKLIDAAQRLVETYARGRVNTGKLTRRHLH
jgi:CheY-like chemotaxis protein